MPLFRLLGKDYELTEQELAGAPKSVLAEAAALANCKTDPIAISTWSGKDPDAFQAS